MNVLYLDFDGVLHPVKGGEPFAAVPVLEWLLEPYADLKIVLSTSWIKTYGYHQSLDFLPEGIRRRVIDGTYGPRPAGAFFSTLTRWEQILGHVQQLRPDRWLALDDDDRGWPMAECRHLVRMSPLTGLLDPVAQANAEVALRATFWPGVSPKPIEIARREVRRLEMHRRVATKLRTDPAWWDAVLDNQKFYTNVHWTEILGRGMEATLAVATENTDRADELRKDSPFSGVLTDQERWDVFVLFSEGRLPAQKPKGIQEMERRIHEEVTGEPVPEGVEFISPIEFWKRKREGQRKWREQVARGEVTPEEKSDWSFLAGAKVVWPKGKFPLPSDCKDDELEDES